MSGYLSNKYCKEVSTIYSRNEVYKRFCSDKCRFLNKEKKYCNWCKENLYFDDDANQYRLCDKCYDGIKKEYIHEYELRTLYFISREYEDDYKVFISNYMGLIIDDIHVFKFIYIDDTFHYRFRIEYNKSESIECKSFTEIKRFIDSKIKGS